MSTYRIRPFDLSRVKTYPLKDRPSKVDHRSFAKTLPEGATFSEFLDSLPQVLAGNEIRAGVSAILNARSLRKAIIWGLGGHVIKVGLAPIIIDLMKRRFISAIAMNGSSMIHDFEIAWVGRTSEDVEAELSGGKFGMAEETGRLINEAILEGAQKNLGIGESMGQFLNRQKLEYMNYSLLAQAYKLKIPVTVHVAVGTDIVHNHPSVSGEATGKGSHLDFRLFASLVALMNEGGVYLNIGSNVILPEVFLKAVTLVRNSGDKLENFTTMNLDFIQHYRPLQNVVQRPTKTTGRGISLIGHHEILVPLLAAALLNSKS